MTKLAGYLLGAFLAGLLALWGYNKLFGGSDAEADKAAVNTASAVTVAAAADTVHDTTVVSYAVYRDRILTSGKATPSEKTTFGKCDAVVLSCEVRHAADTMVSFRLRKELEIAKKRRAGPRVQGYGEGMIDFINQAPVLRLGATIRLFGPVSLSAAGDAMIGGAYARKADVPAIQTRALGGIRINF